MRLEKECDIALYHLPINHLESLLIKTIIHIAHFHPILMINNLSLSKQYVKKSSEVKLIKLLKPLNMCSIPIVR